MTTPAAARSTALGAHGDSDPRRWRMLAILAVSELLGMSLWFAGSAVAPDLAARWSLSPERAAWLTTVVQLGFVVGTAGAATLNLADVVPLRWYFACAAAAAALANVGLAFAERLELALTARFFTGVFLAGVYPPAMKMAATWFRSRRGLAIGTIVGALTVGKATPYLVHALPGASPNVVILLASAAAAAAAVIIAATYADGPFAFPARPFSWALVGSVWTESRWRLATGGYLGHMFELYAFWTWIPAFLRESGRASGAGVAASASFTSALAFVAIAVGGGGCVWGGLAADRRGREWLVTIAMAVSGTCCLLAAVAFGAPFAFVATVTCVWGFFVVADSAQFSALVTESVPAHAVGTALTMQTSLGFLLTMAPIQLVPFLAQTWGWRWAFPMLAVGPVLGIAAIRRLRAITVPTSGVVA